MGILLLLKNNWKLILASAFLVASFFSGWHLKALEEKIKLDKAIAAEQDKFNKQADSYEAKLAVIRNHSDNLNEKLKVIYVDKAYSCVIPDSGLLILKNLSR